MTQLNYAPWNNLLQEFVDDHGRVAYGRWQTEARPTLDDWLNTLTHIDLDQLTHTEATAFLLNLYNALTIRQVLQHYPIDSIRPTFLGFPNWLGLLRFFTRPVYTLNGRILSLNTIENGILRRRYLDPRIHFALVCASGGCPLLRPEAYFPDRLNSQLEADSQRFINNPDKVRYDTTSHTLYCSKIFRWYKADFLTEATSIADYIGRYHTTSLPPNPTIHHLPYSWHLNNQSAIYPPSTTHHPLSTIHN